MYAVVKETGSCDITSTLPHDAFLAQQVAIDNGVLNMYLCESTLPDSNRSKRLHRDLPNPLCYGLCWGSLYFELPNGTMDRDKFFSALKSLTPQKEILCENATTGPDVEMECADISESDGEDDVFQVDDDSQDEADETCEDTLVTCDACNGEGCSICAEGDPDESEIEGNDE